MNEWDSETAEWYAENYGDYATNRLGVDALDLADNTILVDIGCGTGSALRHAAKRISNGKLIGIDPVEKMVEIAQKQTAESGLAEKITFYQAAAESLPLEDNSADLVIAFDSFDHWQSQTQGLKEVHRVLRPKSLFVVVKDASLPGNEESIQNLLSLTELNQFDLVSEELFQKEKVPFILLKFSTLIF